MDSHGKAVTSPLERIDSKLQLIVDLLTRLLGPDESQAQAAQINQLAQNQQASADKLNQAIAQTK